MITALLFFLKKHQHTLFASLVLSLTLFLFFPISVYQKNVGIINFNLIDIGYLLFGFTLAFFLISAAASIFVHKYLFEYPGVLYIAIILCFWVQGNFLTYDLGSLDGHEIDWSMFRNYYVAEVLLWGGVFTAAIWLRKRIYKDMNFLLIVVFLLQISPLAITGYQQYSNNKEGTSLYFQEDQEFEFSSDKNVIIIVIDTARADAFEQVLQRNPKYQETFRDFAFFRNTTAGFSITKPSIPLILSGVYYDNSITYNQYIANTQGDSLPSLLRMNGYTTEYYSFDPFAYRETWNNVSNTPSRGYRLSAFRKIGIVTLLRYLPLPFKAGILEQYYKGANYWGKDIVDLYNNAPNTSKVNKAPVFKFVHLTGAHPPFLLDTSLKLTDNGNYLDQLEASLMAVDKLFDEMKAAGVYDNSLILVTGDHGSTETWAVPQELQQRMTMLMLNGMPMLLAKDFNKNRTEMVVSDSPVSLSDIPKTVMDVLKIKSNLPGISLFADAPKYRSRTFYFYDHWKQIWNADFLPPLYKIEVKGFVRDPLSWHLLGEVYTGSGNKSILPEYYQYGDNIVSPSNFYVKLYSYGFREEKKPGAWAIGPHSCLYLPVKTTATPLSLFLSVQPFLEKEHLPGQQLNISLDDQIVKSIYLETTGRNSMNIMIPSIQNLTTDKQINLCLDFPDAKYSPRDLGMSSDFRTYGGFFDSIIIKEVIPFKLPVEFNFGERGNAAEIVSSGWSNPEPNFTWTTEQHAELQIPIETPPSSNLQLTVSAMPFLVAGKISSQMVTIHSGGIQIGKWIMNRTGEYVVDIPSDTIVNGLLNLEFELPNAASPVSLDISQDTRTLGMAVSWIRIDVQAPQQR